MPIELSKEYGADIPAEFCSIGMLLRQVWMGTNWPEVIDVYSTAECGIWNEENQ